MSLPDLFIGLQGFNQTILPHCVHWFNEIVQILQRFCIVVAAALIALRFAWLRQALRGYELTSRNFFPAIAVFALLALIGTHSGIIIDIKQSLKAQDLTAQWPVKLGETQAIVGFRDTMTMAAGLIGGPWVGFGVGLIAGADRYHLGGFAAFASGFATLVLGLFAGGVRHFKPAWVVTVKGVIVVALTGSLLQRLIILLLVRPYDDAVALSLQILVPVLVINTLGCVLFFWVIRDLDRDRLETEIQETRLLVLQAELRTLRAQVEPHFLNNTLNDLQALIRLDPDKARYYVQQLADFFNYTREFTGLNTISLEQELEQLQRYLKLQGLALGDKLQYRFEVAEPLLALQVLPGCLLTLVENALKHGFKGRPAPYQLVIKGQEDADNLLLTVGDNGRGIAPERLQALGQCPVKSNNKGGGVALYQLLTCLRLVFGEHVALEFDSTLGQGTVAVLTHAKRSAL